MNKSKKRQEDRLVPQSMDGISVDDALRGAMQAPLPVDAKPTKRKPKKAAKKRKK